MASLTSAPNLGPRLVGWFLLLILGLPLACAQTATPIHSGLDAAAIRLDGTPQGEVAWHAVHFKWSSTPSVTAGAANVVAHRQDGTTATFDDASLTILPEPSLELLLVGSGMRGEFLGRGSFLAEPAASWSLADPSGGAAVTGPAGILLRPDPGSEVRWDLTGDLSISSSGDIQVTHANGTETFSGPARVELMAAVVAVGGTPATMAAHLESARLGHAGSATLEAPRGAMPGESASQERGNLRISGRMTLGLTAPDALAVRIDADSATWEALTVAPATRDALPVGWLAALALLPLLAALVLFRLSRRRRPFGVHTLLAERAVLVGDYKTALKQAERALGQNPSDPTGLVVKGIALLELGRARQALQFATDAYQLAPGSAALAYLVATAAAKAGEASQEARWLQQAQTDAQLRPDDRLTPLMDSVRRRHSKLLTSATTASEGRAAL